MPLKRSPTNAQYRLQQLLTQLFRAQVRELLTHLTVERIRNGYDPDLTHWNAAMVTALRPTMLQQFRNGVINGQRKLTRLGVSPQQTIIQTHPAITDAVNRFRTDQSSMRLPRLLYPQRITEAALGGVTIKAKPKTKPKKPAPMPSRILFPVPAKPAGTPTSATAWDIYNPKWVEAVDSATMIFCRETNDTAVGKLSKAIAKLRKALKEGLTHGEALRDINVRVRQIFLDPFRSFRIAVTESKRAIQTGEIVSYKESGLVSKKRWLASSDACELCLDLDGEERGLDEPFYVDPKGGPYAVVLAPPRHPHCFCETVPVLA